mgnify:CR=1 FL=1
MRIVCLPHIKKNNNILKLGNNNYPLIINEAYTELEAIIINTIIYTIKNNKTGDVVGTANITRGGLEDDYLSIKMNDGKEFTTNNLWYQGVIPDYFKSKIPDNAEFVETPEAVGHGQGFLAKW